MSVNTKYSYKQLTNLGEQYNKKILLDFKESLEELLGPILPEHKVEKKDGQISSVEFFQPESEGNKQKDLESKSAELNEKYNSVLEDIKKQPDNFTTKQTLAFLDNFNLKWFDYRNLIIVDSQVMLKCWGVKSKYIEHLMNTAVPEEDMKNADTIIDGDSIELGKPDCELPKEKKSFFTSTKVLLSIILIIITIIFWPRISSYFANTTQSSNIINKTIKSANYPNIGFNDTNNKIKGKVRTSKNKTIEDSRISLYKNDKIVDIVYSNKNGVFEMNNVEPGRYSLKIKQKGYDEEVQYINISKNTKKEELEIFLKKQNFITKILNKIFPNR